MLSSEKESVAMKINNFSQYLEESLMKAWFRILDMKEIYPGQHTQAIILRKFYGGLNPWKKIPRLLNTNGRFVTGTQLKVIWLQ
jgi:hypothetical protein